MDTNKKTVFVWFDQGNSRSLGDDKQEGAKAAERSLSHGPGLVVGLRVEDRKQGVEIFEAGVLDNDAALALFVLNPDP
jgi:hypothetical protein